jgi:hypothetical protein
MGLIKVNVPGMGAGQVQSQLNIGQLVSFFLNNQMKSCDTVAQATCVETALYN